MTITIGIILMVLGLMALWSMRSNKPPSGPFNSKGNRPL